KVKGKVSAVRREMVSAAPRLADKARVRSRAAVARASRMATVTAATVLARRTALPHRAVRVTRRPDAFRRGLWLTQSPDIRYGSGTDRCRYPPLTPSVKLPILPAQPDIPTG